MTMWTPELSDEISTRYEQIAHALETDIARGRLKPGDRLPPQRKLARQLSVTTGTIGRAYALAEKRGLLSSQVGRGAFVTAPESRQSGRNPDGQLVIDLGLNLPPAIEAEADYEKTLLGLSRQRNLGELFGAVPVQSRDHHRRAAARWLQSRIECSPADIVICTGTQSALISTLSAITSPGDNVLVEQWTFPGMLSVARFLGLNLIPVPMDDQGIISGELKKRVGQSGVLYTIPGNQNPTTATMSPQRRGEVVQVARAENLIIVEDDVYGKLLPDSLPAVGSLDPDRSFLISSLAKTLAVGLRLAFLRVPPRWHEQVLHNFQASSFFPVPLSIEIASRWIEEGIADQFVQQRRAIAMRRQAIAREVLDPSWIEGQPSLNHLWLRVPDPWTGHSVQKAAVENGVIVLAASAFSPNGQGPDGHIRISLGGARTDEELRAGLQTVARLLDAGHVSGGAHY